MKDDPLTKEFQYWEDNFNEALTSNNVEYISRFLSDDWLVSVKIKSPAALVCVRKKRCPDACLYALEPMN